MRTDDILRELTENSGTSGRESTVAKAAEKMLSKFMKTRIDKSGNVIGEHDGAGKRFLLDAHSDEIGVIVTKVCENGFLKVSPVGGMDRRVLTGARLTVHGKRSINAVVCSTPPHLAGSGDSSSLEGDIILDTGLDAQDAKELVRAGDTATFRQSFTELQNGRVTAKSLDDRAGIAVLLRACELIFQKNSDINLSVLFSVQEEVGTRGAATGAFSVMPDEAIAVDVSFASAPGVPALKSGKTDGGAMIGVSPALDAGMTDKLILTAEKNNLKYQTEIMGGRTGTNADAISLTGEGVKTALVSIPLRNMHTPAEVVSLDDIESCAQLISLYILENGGAENDK